VENSAGGSLNLSMDQHNLQLLLMLWWWLPPQAHWKRNKSIKVIGSTIMAALFLTDRIIPAFILP
jgi:hypothetical protein